MQDGACICLEAEAGAVLSARRFLERFADLVPPERMEDARLLVSELITNSVRHAGLSSGDRVGLGISVSDGRLRVEVADGGPGFERPPEASAPDRPSGWGLFIVERLSDRWGFERDDTAGVTRVWFEMDL